MKAKSCATWRTICSIFNACERRIEPPPREYVNITLAMVPEFCGTDYRFHTRAHPLMLLQLLQIPVWLVHPNPKRGRRLGEAVFIFFLRRVTSVSRLCDFIKEFGANETTWGTFVNAFARWFYNRRKHLVHTRLHPAIVARFPAYARANDAAAPRPSGWRRSPLNSTSLIISPPPT